MRSFLLPATVAGLLVLSPMAMANSLTTGIVRSIDAKTMMLTLDNGSTYKLPAGFTESSVEVGEKVNVAWVMQGTVHDATSVMPAK